MKKILLIEDSIYTASAIKFLLESQKYQVEHISEGTKAIEIAHLFKPDLIILDLMLPGISGKDVHKMLKSDEKTKNIPILIMTARIDLVKWDEYLTKYGKAMEKPFDNKELLSAVNDMISNKIPAIKIEGRTYN